MRNTISSLRLQTVRPPHRIGSAAIRSPHLPVIHWLGLYILAILVCTFLLLALPAPLLAAGAGVMQVSQLSLSSPVVPASVVTPTVPAAPTGVVTAPSVSVRAQPQPDSGRAGRLLRNQTFKIIGQGRDCTWLQIVSDDGITGWVLANRKSLRWDVDCTTLPRGTFRPATGTRQGGFPNGGAGALKIENEGDEDVVVVLITRDRRHKQVSYVRGNEEHIADAIPNGAYEIYLTTGAEWNGEQFTEDVVREKFEDIFPYDSAHGKYGWRIVLNSDTEGSAVMLPVEEDDFPPVLYE